MSSLSAKVIEAIKQSVPVIIDNELEKYFQVSRNVIIENNSLKKKIEENENINQTYYQKIRKEYNKKLDAFCNDFLLNAQDQLDMLIGQSITLIEELSHLNRGELNDPRIISKKKAEFMNLINNTTQEIMNFKSSTVPGEL